MSDEIRLTPVEYAIYGVLCAAKLETGPLGGRRMYRIQERIDVWDDATVYAALQRLHELGWIRQMVPTLPGMVHFESVPLSVSSDGGRVTGADPATSSGPVGLGEATRP